MPNKHKELLIAFLLLIITSGVGYYVFTEYKPKAIQQLEEVRGVRSDKSNSIDLPYPDKAQNISLTKTDDFEQVSFKTTKTKDEVKQYYKNVLATLGWKMISEATYDDYTVAKFSKENTKVTIMSFEEENEEKSLVGIEISRN